jgi:transposase
VICGEWSPEKQRLPEWMRIADGSDRHARALKIVAMRGDGQTDDEIAAALGIKKSTLQTTLYRAGRNGLLDFDSYKDQVEFQLIPKIVARLERDLNSETPAKEMSTGTHIALKVFEHTVAKTYDQATQAAPPTTIVGIKVQIVGDIPPMREGTSMGTNAYVDAEPVE